MLVLRALHTCTTALAPAPRWAPLSFPCTYPRNPLPMCTPHPCPTRTPFLRGQPLTFKLAARSIAAVSALLFPHADSRLPKDDFLRLDTDCLRPSNVALEARLPRDTTEALRPPDRTLRSSPSSPPPSAPRGLSPAPPRPSDSSSLSSSLPSFSPPSSSTPCDQCLCGEGGEREGWNGRGGECTIELQSSSLQHAINSKGNHSPLVARARLHHPTFNVILCVGRSSAADRRTRNDTSTSGTTAISTVVGEQQGTQVDREAGGGSNTS